MTVYAMAERIGREAKARQRGSLADLLIEEINRQTMLAEARAVDRDMEARRLISLLAERTNSRAELDACKAWLEARS